VRVVFMGSPEFAVPCLRALAGAHEVVLVVSQPDKPAGRGGQLTAPAVKVAALELGLPVIQPRSARTGELREALLASGAQLAVVVAYGKILPKDVLEALPRGCINAIEPDETSGELLARLAPIGAAALLDALARIERGEARPVAQEHAAATHAAMLRKADGAIDFAQPAAKVASRIRGVDPWPGAQATLRGQIVKLFRARPVAAGAGDAFDDHGHRLAPGTVIGIDGDGLRVACGDGAVVIRELQAPGRKRLAAAQMAAGRGVAVGDVLTKPELA